METKKKEKKTNKQDKKKSPNKKHIRKLGSLLNKNNGQICNIYMLFSNQTGYIM